MTSQLHSERVASLLPAASAPAGPGSSDAEQTPLEAANRPIMVPTASLRPHPLSLAIYGDEPVDPDLAESVRELGILEPLAVLSDGAIVSGHRRSRLEPQPKLAPASRMLALRPGSRLSGKPGSSLPSSR